MKTVEEIWKKVTGFPFYEASNLGRVRSIPRDVPHWRGGTRRMKGKVLKLVPHRGDHSLRLSDGNGHCINLAAHQVVARAFLGEPQDGMVVIHKDGDRTNDSPDNLKYVTSSESTLHEYRIGRLSNKGETNGQSKLTDEIVRQIRAQPEEMTAREVAAKVGCKKHSVYQIRSGRAWSHVA